MRGVYESDLEAQAQRRDSEKELVFHTIPHDFSLVYSPPDQIGEIPRCHPTCVTTPDKKQRVRVPLPLLFLGCWHTEETILMVAQSP